MAGRKLFSTSCDDDGNLHIELMEPTRKALMRAEFICANLAKSIPQLAVPAAETASALADIVAVCSTWDDGDEEDEDFDEDDTIDLSDSVKSEFVQTAQTEVIC